MVEKFQKNLGGPRNFENCQDVENLQDQKLNVPREQKEQHYNPTLDHAAARLVKTPIDIQESDIDFCIERFYIGICICKIYSNGMSFPLDIIFLMI